MPSRCTAALKVSGVETNVDESLAAELLDPTTHFIPEATLM